LFFFSFCNTSCNKYFMSAANTKKLEEKISWRTDWKPVSTGFCQSFIYPKIVRTGTAYWGHEAEPDQKQFSRTGSGPVRFQFFRFQELDFKTLGVGAVESEINHVGHGWSQLKLWQNPQLSW
jgi:hypothetical protein